METVAVQYLGGSSEVYVPAAGVTATRGEDGKPGPAVEVPAGLAGREPFWRAQVDGDPDHLQTRASGEFVEVLDPGTGLLAQTDLWQRAVALDVTEEA